MGNSTGDQPPILAECCSFSAVSEESPPSPQSLERALSQAQKIAADSRLNPLNLSEENGGELEQLMYDASSFVARREQGKPITKTDVRKMDRKYTWYDCMVESNEDPDLKDTVPSLLREVYDIILGYPSFGDEDQYMRAITEDAVKCVNAGGYFQFNDVYCAGIVVVNALNRDTSNMAPADIVPKEKLEELKANIEKALESIPR